MLKKSALALAILAVAAVPAVAYGPFDFGHGGRHFDVEPGMILLGGIALILALSLTWVVVRRNRRPPVSVAMPAPASYTHPIPAGSAPVAPTTAFAILAERFARGEIDRKEYEDRRAGLAGEVRQEQPAPPAAG